MSVNQELPTRQYEFDNSNDKNINLTDWHALTKENVINIAETLSNPKHKEQVLSKHIAEFETQNKEINEIIKQALLNLKKIYSTCFDNLQSLIDPMQLIQNFDAQQQSFQNEYAIKQSSKKLSFNCSHNIIDIEVCRQNKTLKAVVCQKKFKLRDCESILSLQLVQGRQKILAKNTTKLAIQFLNKPSKPANYQLLSQYSIAQYEFCCAIAINSKQTFMVAGCNNQIKVFEFQNGQIKQIQLLSDHTNNIYALYFMKKTNQFISGSADNTIRIWNMKDIKQWYMQQLLKDGHTSTVNQVIMNTNEDLIISCSYDKSIKFWVKIIYWKCNQTLKAHTGVVWQISFNDSKNQLVSCGDDLQIIISQQDGEQKWTVIQTIKVEQEGRRICYIGDNMIAFQQLNGVKMDIFELNELNKQFIKSKDVKIENDSDHADNFPQIFNTQKSILLNKNGSRINLMKRKNSDEIVIEQYIKFGHQNFYGTMTEDGEYLITWDVTSRQFQVRKQQQ